MLVLLAWAVLHGPAEAIEVRETPRRSSPATAVATGLVVVNIRAADSSDVRTAVLTLTGSDGKRQQFLWPCRIVRWVGDYELRVTHGERLLRHSVHVGAGRTVQLDLVLPAAEDPCRVERSLHLPAGSRVTLPIPCAGRSYRLSVKASSAIDVFVTTAAQIRAGRLADFKPRAAASGVRDVRLVFAVPDRAEQIVVLDNSRFPGDRDEGGFVDATVTLKLESER
ncbi:MAG: hypothetical protein HY814_14675 [Candidatus Riflebacteria bacterium]|nr:hypothetical protein [Candidatus Riflebacteria bacterium]